VKATEKPFRQDVRLARAGVAERDDVVAAQDVFAAREFENQHLVEAGNDREVERVEALDRRKARLANAPFDNAPFPIDEFQLDQSQEIGSVIDPLARRFPGHLVVLAQDGRQLQLFEMMREQELWRSARRARRHRLRGGRLVGFVRAAHARLPDKSTA